MKYARDLPDFVELLRAYADGKKQRKAIVEKDYPQLGRRTHKYYLLYRFRQTSLPSIAF